MILTITYLFIHFLACFLLFEVVQKPLFIAYNRKLNTEKITAKTITQIYTNGCRSDLVACAYLTILPLLVCWIHLHAPFFRIHIVLTACNILLSAIFALTILCDSLLYKFWQYKLDSSVFVYLRSLKGAFASVSTRYIVTSCTVLLLLWVGIFFVLYSTTLLLSENGTVLPRPLIWHIVTIVLYIALLGVLFLLVRGEGIRPNNPSIAYFSKNVFLNHCALNPLYNLVYSLSVTNEYKGKFHAFDDKYCEKKFASLFPTSGTTQVQLLKNSRPNILFVVWESLGAQFMESLGGTPDVAINTDRLTKEGVLFTNYYSGSFRTDRALVCIFSGCPAQPTASLIRHTRKVAKLPALPRRLRDIGYDTVAIHGGDCYIMHKSEYYSTSGHTTVLEQKDFTFSAETCRWGIHDGYMFDWIAEYILQRNKTKKPWMITFQTLSSHEPFVVPYTRLDNKMNNSFAYTDHCFGQFVEKLKQTSAWDNLLIICTGDHNINYGGTIPRNEYAHIPLLLLGGAISEPQKIDTIMSQTDIAATLLGQMGLPHDEFRYSRNVLADTYTYPFAFHTYVNGFFFRDNTGFTTYDNVAQSAIEGADPQREETAKVILQTLYSDLSKL